MKQFDIYEADLSPIIGSEQGGIRPVIILQSQIFDSMDRILCAPITSKEFNNDIHIMVNIQSRGRTYIMSEQIRNIDKVRLRDKIGELVEADRQKVKEKLSELLNI